jgi:hypothetical protein
MITPPPQPHSAVTADIMDLLQGDEATQFAQKWRK